MADNYNVKDAAGSTIVISAKEEVAGLYSPRMTPRVNSADVSAANPLPVTVANPALTSLDTKTPALGQAAMAASVPVAIAHNQSALPVSIVTASVGFGTADGLNLAGLNAKTPALGQSTMSASVPVTLASNQTAVPVSVTGVATAAKQPNFSTAGAPSADVVTVQGVSGATPIPVVVTSGSSVNILTNVVTGAASGVIKGAPGSIHGYMLFNSSASPLYLRFVNSNTVPNSAAAPIAVFGLASGASANFSLPDPIPCSGGIAYRVMSTPTGAGTDVTQFSLTTIYS